MTASTRFPFLLLSVLACSLAPAQFLGTYSGSPNVPIPPFGSGGSPGGCATGSSNNTEFSLGVSDAFVVTHVRVELTLNHSYVGDLTLKLRHCGTTVVLYDRSPSSSSDLNGTYVFDDQANLAFAAYVTTPGTVPPNTYQPVTSLASFVGMSSAGDWTISICDQASGDTGHLTSMGLVLDGGQTYGTNLSPALPIPDGGAGCAAPLVRAINVPTAGSIDRLFVEIGLDHDNVQDLNVTISHDGVSATLIAAGSIHAGAGVQGNYWFSDVPSNYPSLVALGNLTVPGNDIPTGIFIPASPLSVFVGHSKQGVWLVSVCDTLQFTTGVLSLTAIEVSDSAWDLTVSQPLGPGTTLVFDNKGGSPGDTFVNLATVVPGSFPFGWLNGLDISMNEILVEISLGSPVIGVLGSCGSSTTSIQGPIPPGLAIQFVSFELDASGTPVASEHAFQYVTL
jgi:subtilisin-like proprotein convertase family protein